MSVALSINMPDPHFKVGVLTFHRCINYGSYWQARCLVDGLRGLGYEAELLEHVSDRVNRAEWRCALQPLLPQRTPQSDYPLYDRKTRRFFEAVADLPTSAPFPLDDPSRLAADYDVVVIGSDEVWNLNHPWYGGHPLFYGEGLRAGRLVAYAASFGSQTQGLEPYWAERLGNFAQISIRDRNSQQIVARATHRMPELVLDPCLLFPPDVTAEGLGRPYLAVYGHSFPDWFAEAVRSFAWERGLELISIGYRNDWADRQWLTAGPLEFASFMAGAEAVATNFFHGCVFALMNNKPFACAPSDYRFNKVRDLTAMVGASAHLTSSETPPSRFGRLLGEPLDSAIGRSIAALRRHSRRYLERVLQ
ncbi:hypothetical protein VE25_06350 [Devosia geojensis]|uniref:Polysaccharide pyruvyl transferase domain-containing protein n=1 Tax=Devosia geojensis TaxID=443610 RepID=A0A0F5FUQ0_9HYPH|nr:polysaccharide pyruvyl transferase family protein [Devosia geojensis]KKB12543.1 hypothetical protein VE25_06350 [Devosia geojensis]